MKRKYVTQLMPADACPFCHMPGQSENLMSTENLIYMACHDCECYWIKEPNREGWGQTELWQDNQWLLGVYEQVEPEEIMVPITMRVADDPLFY